MYEAAAAPAAATPAATRRSGSWLCPGLLMPAMVPRSGQGGGMVDGEMNSDSPSTVEQKWLACAVEMGAAGKAAAQPLYGTAAGRAPLGAGAGGDTTMQIDRACEEAIRRVLEEQAPAPYRLVSEEVGLLGPEDSPWCVVVDPVDGSLNAKHGLQPSCASIAVARGNTLADVAIAHIEDYTRPQAFWAVKGAGMSPTADPHRFQSDQVEVLLLEAGRPDLHDFQFRDLAGLVVGAHSAEMRVRQIGSIALCLCYLATGVADVLVAAVSARSVDMAAGFLILKEAGGGVSTLDGLDIWAQPLDLEKRSPFVAWRAGLDGPEIASRARRLSSTLRPRP